MDVAAVLFDLGRRVAELRAARGLTQEALAEVLGMEPTELQKIEGGKVNATVRTLARLATALECPLTALFEPPLSREVRPGRPRRRP